MADDYELEEEDFTAQFNVGTFRRILRLVKPHWRWVAGFLFTIAWVSILDAVFTFLSKRIIDEASSRATQPSSPKSSSSTAG